eukprot:CAMPEP_0194406372 /NCGR_PEP_ID=MMETSP0176-20130528/4606_1 /TAXON_ID=216777 /ORGANISM="Proboscia alata, Strain PI-D3" /LENGTH=552 /DNA_ID=CAMNT_0039205571 /DNA_START=38 /DNA_END=1696 /DNA_ORIENTATION=+
MTKPLVQGQIGYWVNGELVHMPKKRPSPKSKYPETAHLKRNRERKEKLNALAARRCQKKLLDNFNRNTIQPPRNFIEGLKNASKSGHIESVCKQLKSIQLHMAARAKDKTCNNLFRLWTGCIFLPDIEERTALYYASLTGHSRIVELYMSLYLVSAIQISETNIRAAYTFRNWFSSMRGTCKLKLAKNFTLEDYDVCILNALNERVRHTLTRQKVTIIDAMDILSKGLNENAHIDGISLINTRIKCIKTDLDRMTKFLRNKENKSKKPMLKYDALNDVYEDDDLWTEEDYYVDTTSNTECDAYVDKTRSSDERVDTKEKSARYEISTNSDLSIDSSIFFEQDFDISIASSNIIDEGDFVEVEDIVEDADSTADFSFLNCATSINNSQISLEELHVDNDGKDEETTVGWDMVSELQSVNSMGESLTTMGTGTDKTVLHPSTHYRDMLLKTGKPIVYKGGTHTMKVHTTTTNTVNSKQITQSNEKMAAILEENDQMNDAHWERDGFKNGRGGKSGKMFRGNDRTPKSYNNWQYGQGIPSKQQRYLQNSCRKLVK